MCLGARVQGVPFLLEEDIWLMVKGSWTSQAAKPSARLKVNGDGSRDEMANKIQ